MGKIKILPLHEAQKIAAGEIVERPANVVKELVENALDAGATHISVLLEEGGKKLISVIDNGCGMVEEDARLSIHNHATSKLRSVDELDAIATFGFRGEALASIASVSQMTLATKTREMQEGLQLTIEHGTIVDEMKIACNNGTSIIIRNLFYNLPARKKFLKKDETEWNAIQHMMQALALTHYTCSFTVQHNQHIALHAPSTQSLQERVAQIFDTALSTHITPCAYRSPEKSQFSCSLQGVVSHPHYHRYDRNHLFFFVNNRWVKNQKLAQTLIKAYAGVLPDKRYPAAVIFITIEPTYVDINIHPRKEEVQFLHPRIIEEALYTMTHAALQTKTSQDLGKQAIHSPHVSHETSPWLHPRQPDVSSTTNLQKTMHTGSNAPQREMAQWHFGRKKEIPQPHILQTNSTSSKRSLEPISEQQELHLPQPCYDHPEYRLVGVIHATYIVLETDEGMVMIDQHAAHERIFYEQFSKRFEQIATINLMFPSLITLSAHDHSIITPWLSLFIEHGIILEPLSSTQFIVKAVPVALKNSSIEELIKTALSCLHENSMLTPEELKKLLYHNMRSMMACKAAVKAGDVLDDQQINELIKNFHATDNRMTCPHGRPTTWKFSRSEIERKFKRSE